ncbi:MAG: hypothetical protein ACK4N5_02755, partial [Myxococcales bacterium]
GGRMSSTLLLGSLLFAAFWAMQWAGRDVGRAARAGVLAGVPALLLALAAQLTGHVCVGTGCYSLCLPACAAGGLLAGGIAVRLALKSQAPGATIAAAAGVSFLTGALGCTCIGYSGVVGLSLGLAATAGPGMLLAVLRRR